MQRHASSATLMLIATVLSVVACRPDAPPTGLAGVRPATALVESDPWMVASVCHEPSGARAVIEIPRADLATHLSHGDYVARYRVRRGAAVDVDGIVLPSITAALGAARAGRLARAELTREAAACRVTITVEPGEYVGAFAPDTAGEAFPLRIDVPALSLEGSFAMRLDARGRATGNAVDESASSVLRPKVALEGSATLVQALIVVANASGGSRGDGAEVRGFVFRSGRGLVATDTLARGFGIFALGVTDLVVDANRFEKQFASALDLRASRASITRNDARALSRSTCGFCLAGPGRFDVEANRLVASGVVGVFVLPVFVGAVPAGVTAYAAPARADVEATIANNLLRDHDVSIPGTAIRIATAGSTGTVTLPQTSDVRIESNELIRNRFGIIMDAGFPSSAAAPQPSDLVAGLSGNTFVGSCQVDLFVTFARHTRSLPVTAGGTRAYLRNSTYRLDLGGYPWSSVWYDHPANDTTITLNNRLLVDGADILNGAFNAYTPAACAPVPVADAGPAYAGTEGTPIAFSGSSPSGGGVDFQWTFGDGASATGPAPTHTFADEGTYEATLVVVNAAGVPSLPVTTSVVVANAAPAVSIGGITTGTPGAITIASLSASFTDLGLSDQHTATIDWGDGSAPEPGALVEANGAGSVTGSHAYATAGTFTVSVTVRDGDGGVGTSAGAATIAVTRPANVWVGLKNSDAVGLKLDLLAEVFRNGARVAVGQVNAVPGGSSGFNNAVLRTVQTALAASPAYGAGDTLAVTISARVAVGVPGHTSGTARLWYGDVSANSAVTTLVNGATRTYFLVGGDLLSPTTGTARTWADVTVRLLDGNPFRAFRTWRVVF